MFEKLSSVFGGGKGAAAPAELEQTFRALQAISGSLYQRTLAYITTGEDPGVLADLAAEPRVGRFLGNPAGSSHFWSPSKAEDDELIAKAAKGWKIDAGSKARGRLYARIDELDPLLVARFGRVVLAALGSKAPPVLSPEAPEWFSALLFDAFVTVGKQRFHDGSDDANAQGRHARWSPALLEALVATDDVAADDRPRQVLLSVFDRAELSRYFAGSALKELTTIPGIQEYVVQHAGLLTAIAPAMSLDGRQSLLAFLATRPELLPTFSTLLGDLATDSSKAVRQEAFAIIDTMPVAERVATLARLLPITPNSRLASVIDALARVPEGAGVPPLQEALAAAQAAKGATAAKKVELIENVLHRGDALDTEVAVVERPAWEPFPDEAPGPEFVVSARAALDAAIARTRESIDHASQQDRTDKWAIQNLAREKKHLERLRSVKDSDLQEVARYLGDGAGARPSAIGILSVGAVAKSLAGLGVLHVIRLFSAANGYYLRNQLWMVLGDGADVDLRRLADALARGGVEKPVATVDEWVFHRWGGILEDLSPENVWPFYDEHPELISQAFAPGHSYGDVGRAATAIAVLGTFPVLPAEAAHRVTEIALGEGKTNRREAQALLEQHPGAVSLAVRALGSAKLEVRASAAGWLANIGSPDGIAPLRAALAKEKREVVKAALLSALERLGDDVSGDLAPAALEKEAKAGLAGKVPAGLAWFPFASLPAARWADGSTVKPDVIRYWVTLAVKLKDPSATGIIGRYLTLLDDRSRRELGTFVLQAWIAQDTAGPSDAEARAFAEQHAATRSAQAKATLARYPQYAQYYEAEAALSVDDWFERLRREHAATYLGSAIGEKGLLAIASGAPGTDLAAAIQRYMKAHYQRRAQVEALVIAAASSDDPAALQLVLATARRHRTASVQTRAQALVEEIAERRGWTPDQLADRTVPTAGFDDDGLLVLDFGSRRFTGRLSPALALEVTDEAGKVIKALPAPRVTDDAELAKEAKTQLSTTKKELKQLLDLQVGRLYEAMCTGRQWPVDEFTEFVLGHPIMARLAAGLVWIERSDDSYRVFRPSGDGTLIDANDDDVVLTAGSLVEVAHSSLLTAEETDAWRTHLTDYAVAQPFAQLEAVVPSFAAGAEEIVDRKGWLTDTFTIRGTATKLGYARGAGEDGGWFGEYTKDFASTGLRIALGFTGNTLPEENVPAATTDLTFWDRSGRRQRRLPLAEVPPIMLAEAYRDYLTVAAVGAFDAEWEKKSAW